MIVYISIMTSADGTALATFVPPQPHLTESCQITLIGIMDDFIEESWRELAVLLLIEAAFLSLFLHA